MSASSSDAWRVLPLYVGLAVMASAAAAGLTLTIDEPAFAFLLHATIIVGLALSYVGALRCFSPGVVGALIAALAVPAASLRRPDLPVLGLFYPPEVVPQDDLVLATLAAWGLAAFCFAVANRSYIVFAFACGLTVFGLTGTLNVNRPFLAAYFVFLIAGIFVWGYDTLLSHYDRALQAAGAPPSSPRRWVQSYLGLTMLQGAAVLALALGVGYPLYKASPFLYGQGPRSWLLHYRTPTPQSNYMDFGGAFELGTGPITLGRRPVLRVKAGRPELWRAVVYDEYDGHSWRTSPPPPYFVRPPGTGRPSPTTAYGPPAGGQAVPIGPAAAAPSEPRGGPPGAASGPTPAAAVEMPDDTAGVLSPGEGREYWPPTDESGRPAWLAARPRLMQDVQLLIPTGYTLPGAAEPVEVKGLQGELSPGTIDPYGCIRSAPFPRGERAYRVISAVPDATGAQLRQAGTEVDLDTQSRYVSEVPVGTRLGLEELVQQIAADAGNSYDRLLAIEAYLYEHCRYSLEEAPIPRDRDAVAYFVREQRAGACDMFASALAIMGRLAGVPTRVATGFATGEDVVGSDGQPAYLVRQSDAHAWVEAYFPGYGWIPFDPPTQERESTWLDRLVTSTGQYLGPSRAWRRGVWVLVGAAAVYLVLTGAFGLPGLGAWRGSRSPGRHQTRARIGRSYERLCRAMARRGWPRHPWQTPREHTGRPPDGRRDRTGEPEAQQAVRETAELFSRLRYSPREPTAQEAEEFAARAAALARELRRRRRS